MFNFELNSTHICQTTVFEKTLTSVLGQNEQHEQIKIMAKINGPFCLGVENDKGNILESGLWKNIECIMVRF